MVRFVRRGKRFGLVNDKQRVVVPFVFDRIEPFIDGFGVGSIDRFGDYLYDESGKMMFGQPFDTITRRGLSQDEKRFTFFREYYRRSSVLLQCEENSLR